MRGPQAQAIVNRFHFRQASSLVFDTPGEDLVEAWRANVEAFYLSCFQLSTTVYRYEVRGISDPLYGHDADLSPTVTGGQSGDAVPPQAASIISWRTGVVGRSFRGRTYLPPLSESQQVAGIISATQVSNIEGFFTALQSLATIGVTTAAWDFVLWSPTRAAATLITQAIAQQYIGTQRRRRLGSGS